jgi:hypothetical protein
MERRSRADEEIKRNKKRGKNGSGPIGEPHGVHSQMLPR